MRFRVFVCLSAILGSWLFSPAQADPLPSKNLVPPITHLETSERDSNFGYMGIKNWQFSLFGTAKATMALEDSSLKITVTQTDGTDWHSQLRYDADAVNGTVYELKFRAKADAARPLRLTSEFDDEKTNAFHETGLNWTCSLTREWRTFTSRFSAHDVVDGKCILPIFWFGQKTGTIWLSDVSLVPLPPGSSLACPVTDTAAWGLDLWGKDAKGAYQPGLGPNVAMSVGGKAAKFVVTGETKDSWSAYDTHTALKENTAYTLSFRARSDAPRPLSIQGEKEPNGQANGGDGLNQRVDVTTQWQPYTITFTTAAGTGGQNKLPEFIVGDMAGTLWLSDVSLVAGTPPAPASASGMSPALPETTTGPKPRTGEIKLTGTVMEVHVAAKSVLLAVIAVTQPDGTTTTLPAPRPKTILLNAQTLVVTSDLTQKTLAEIKDGDTLTIIGKDSGVGKPLTARTVLLP